MLGLAAVNAQRKRRTRLAYQRFHQREDVCQTARHPRLALDACSLLHDLAVEADIYHVGGIFPVVFHGVDRHCSAVYLCFDIKIKLCGRATAAEVVARAYRYHADLGTVYACRAVKQRVFGMQMQMRKRFHSP